MVSTCSRLKMDDYRAQRGAGVSFVCGLDGGDERVAVLCQHVAHIDGGGVQIAQMSQDVGREILLRFLVESSHVVGQLDEGVEARHKATEMVGQGAKLCFEPGEFFDTVIGGEGDFFVIDVRGWFSLMRTMIRSGASLGYSKKRCFTCPPRTSSM